MDGSGRTRFYLHGCGPQGGDIVFEHPVHISGNLNVTGSVNRQLLKPLLKSAVRVDRPVEITAVKKFAGKVRRCGIGVEFGTESKKKLNW